MRDSRDELEGTEALEKNVMVSDGQCRIVMVSDLVVRWSCGGVRGWTYGWSTWAVCSLSLVGSRLWANHLATYYSVSNEGDDWVYEVYENVY